MLKQTQTVLPAADLRRARAFYSDTLGLEPTDEQDGMLIYRQPGGSSFGIYETENAGTAKNTQMCFLTDDLDAEMRQLRERGLVFEEYDMPGLTTSDGVAELGGGRAAWFRDSEGNYICLTEEV